VVIGVEQHSGMVAVGIETVFGQVEEARPTGGGAQAAAFAAVGIDAYTPMGHSTFLDR
jgi:hypothetical protein